MNSPTLVSLSGLPGTGKSTIARNLAQALPAVWLRIDTIEEAIRRSRKNDEPMDDLGYRIAHAIAEDNLRLGIDVVADCVNPWMLTRDAWRDLARRCGAAILEVEIICSNKSEHRRRIETREPDIEGLLLPDWSAVTSRDYHDWTRARLQIDTFGRTPADCVAEITAASQPTAP